MKDKKPFKKYEIIEHTADLKIRAYGRDLPDLFSNALKGMFESVKPKMAVQKTAIEREIKVQSVDRETLLIDFLSEALYLSDVNNEAYFEAEFFKFNATELEGTIKGEKIEGFEEEIKAVTYHGIEIKRVGDQWEAVVLFDV